MLTKTHTHSGWSKKTGLSLSRLTPLYSSPLFRQTYLIAHLIVEATKIAIEVLVAILILVLVRVAATHAAHHWLIDDDVAAADHVVHIHLIHNATALVGQHVVAAHHIADHVRANHIVQAAADANTAAVAAHVIQADAAAHLGDALIHVLRLDHLLVQVLSLRTSKTNRGLVSVNTQGMSHALHTCFVQKRLGV